MDKNFINTYFKKSNIILFFILLAGINIIFNILKQYSIANNFLLFSIFCSAFILFALIIFNLKEIIQNKNYKKIYNIVYTFIFFIIILMIINENINYQYSKYYYRKISNNILDTYIYTQITLLIYIFIPFLIGIFKKIKLKISNFNPTKNLLPGDKILIIALIFIALMMLTVYLDSKTSEKNNNFKGNTNSNNYKELNMYNVEEFLKQSDTK